jgi:hypothetical protein
VGDRPGLTGHRAPRGIGPREEHEMNTSPSRALRAGLSAGLAAFTFTACNESDPVEQPPEPTVLQGTAAIGAPMAGATVTVIDGDAATADPAPVRAGADGSYRIDVSGLRAPLLVRAEAVVDGEAVRHVAVLGALQAGGANTANVTPLTTAVAALAAPGGQLAALTDAQQLAAAAAQAGNAARLLVNTLRSDPVLAAALGSSFDPVGTAFVANGSGIDAALHQVTVRIDAGRVLIENPHAPPGENGAAAPVALTAAMVATPDLAPPLPPSAPSGSTPEVAQMQALAQKIQACLALPVSQRVTLDAAGNVTQVLGICDFVPPDWRSNGRSFAQEVGQFALAKNQLGGAKFGTPTILAALAPQGHTDPKVFKHPYCNDGPCVVARFPLTTASGRPAAMDWLLGKVNGQWNFVGNQRPYRVFVEARLNRKINMNRNGPAPGNSADPYFFQDRHESLLRLIFDLSVGDTSDVRAVRFTGPGLPAAGVVQVRSQRCGSDDRMAITNQVGSTRVIGGASNGLLQFWSGGSAAEFILGAARLDGTPLPTPVPVNTANSAGFQDFTPVVFADVSKVAPDWSVYKVEVFRFSSNSDAPDEVIYLRNGSGPENPALGPTLAWPTLDAAYATAHLTPGGSGSGELGSFAQSLSWTVPDGYYVSSSYLFGQNFANATNTQNETASYGLRGRIDHEPLALGDTTAAGWRMASPVAGTALSPATANSGSNPNPRCGNAIVPALSENPADYREAGLFIRSPDRRVRQAIWFWDN